MPRQPDNVGVVERAIRAVNQRDVDGYLACCTDDVQLWLPTSAVGGAYEGADGVRRFFEDIKDAGPDFRLDLERAEAIRADVVVASLQFSASGRTTGIPMGMATTNVYDMSAGKIRRVRVFGDHAEAMEAIEPS